MRRGGIGVVLAAGLAALLPAPAAAAPFRGCGGELEALFKAQCRSVRVPIDRSGGVPGTIDLRVQRIRARHRSKTALLALAGGPGSAATNSMFDFALLLEPGLRNRDLIVFDQRGTGRSGLLRCPSVEAIDFGADAAAACAARLGPRRAFYTSQDTVADIEAVRRAAGADKLAIYGVSYGTKVAQQYAPAHPDRVERLVLDSVLPVEGVDPFELSSFAAMTRIQSDICAPGCHPSIGDPAANLAAVTGLARMGQLSVDLFDGAGAPEHVTILEADLHESLEEMDFEAGARSTSPAAIRSAVNGDQAPLARLVRRLTYASPPRPRDGSLALTVTTLCEESLLPWDRSTPPADRPAAAQRALEAQPEAAFAPWSRSLGLLPSQVTVCAGWPASDRPPADLSGRLPDVPVLLLSGEHDVRTPVADAERVAAAYPHANLVVVPGIGHSVLGQDTDIFDERYGCAYRAVRQFFARDRAAPCAPKDDRAPLPADPFPTSPKAYKPLAAPGARGQTLAAVMATMQDAVESAYGGSEPGAGGLRGGSVRVAREGGLVLRGYSYVPGVAVSGRYNDTFDDGDLRVSGPAAQPGTLKFSNQSFTGRVGGRRVRGTFALFDPLPMARQQARARRTAPRLPR